MGTEDGSPVVPALLGRALGTSCPTSAPPIAEGRRFQKDVADGTAVTVPVGRVALSAEEQRNVEAFGNRKMEMKEPAAPHPWLSVGG